MTGNIRKRFIALLMTIPLATGMCQTTSFAAGEGISEQDLGSPTNSTADAGQSQLPDLASDENGEAIPAAAAKELSDIDETTYKNLGLNVKEYDVNNTFDAPYGMNPDAPTTILKDSEVYLLGSGYDDTKYFVRNGFDKMNGNTSSTHISDEYGRGRGSLYYYDFFHSHKGGASVDSCFSSNEGNSMAVQKENRDPLVYASSMEFDAGEGYDNYVAELRAYGIQRTSNDAYGGIDIQISRMSENGEKKLVNTLNTTINDRSYRPTYIKDDRTNYFRYLHRRFNQELEGFFDIATGDADGDGRDEIYAYSGAYQDTNGIRYAIVDVYHGLEGGNFEHSSIQLNAGPSSCYESSDHYTYAIDQVPIVSIATGDLERNGTEEVAFTVSAPLRHSKVAAVSKVCVYGCRKKYKQKLENVSASKADEGLVTTEITRYEYDLQPIPGLKEVSLAAPDGQKAMVAASCTFGSFKDGGGYRTVLLTAGYQSHDGGSLAGPGFTAFDTSALKYMYYDEEDDKYIASPYFTQTLGKDAYRISDSYDKYTIVATPAPLALACADMGGSDHNEYILLGGDIYQTNIFAMNKSGNCLGNSVASVSICAAQQEDFEGKNVNKDLVWIGDVRVASVDTDTIKKGYRESFIYKVGVRYDARIKEDGFGDTGIYWNDLGVCYVENGNFCSSQEGVINYYNDYNSKKYCNTAVISLCTPDVDKNSIAAKFSESFLAFSNPEVKAILEAPPYYKDLKERYSYCSGSNTTITQTSGTSEGGSSSGNWKVGTYESLDLSAAIYGFNADYSLEYTGSYTRSTTKKKDISTSANAAAGANHKVLLSALTSMIYVYEYKDPTTKETKYMYAPSCSKVSTSLMDVDKYDKIAATTNGLDTIGNKALKGIKSGDPSTYNMLPEGTLRYTTGKTSTVVASGGGTQSQSIAIGSSQTESWSHGMSTNLKMGTSVGNLIAKAKVGISMGGGFSIGTTSTTSEGTTFAGSVANVPSNCDDYSFNWNLNVLLTNLNNKNVWTIAYKTDTVKRPSAIPSGLKVIAVGKNDATVQWDKVPEAEKYEVAILDDEGNYNSKEIVSSGKNTCQITGLYPNRTYKVSVRTLSEKRGNSVYSQPFTINTLANKAEIEFSMQPEAQSVHSGESTAFEVAAKYKEEDGTEYDVKYQWQVKEGENWKNLEGKTDSTLTLKEVSRYLDTYEYRCRVHYNDLSGYSESALLRVEAVPSKTSFSLHNDTRDEDLKDKDTICASMENKEDGDKLSLTANVDSDIADTVYFVIDGPVSTEICAVKDENGKFISNWQAPQPGVYKMHAKYNGSDILEPSVSEDITLYAVRKDSKELSLYVREEMTYGQTADLQTFILENAGSDTKVTDITKESDLTYKVRIYYEGTDQYEDAEEDTYEIKNNTFIPKTAETFLITAVYKDSKSQEMPVRVNHKALTISAPNMTVTKDEQKDAKFPPAVIEGLVDGDVAELTENVDYRLESDGQSARRAGDYDIVISLIRDKKNLYTDTIKELKHKYAIKLVDGTYTLKEAENTYYVYGDVNGAGTISMQALSSPDDSNPKTLEDGDVVEKNSRVRWTAKAAQNNFIDHWTLVTENGEETVIAADGSTGSGIAYKGDTIEIASVEKDYTYKVYFSGYNLNLDVSATTLIYGNAVTLHTVLHANETEEDVTESATYDIKYFDDDAEKYVKAEQSMYEIRGNEFIAKAAGKFQISASSHDAVSNVCKIKVNKKNVTLNAVDKDVNQHTSESDRLLDAAKFSGLCSWDEDLTLEEGKDYKQTSKGVTTEVFGEYPIELTWIMNESTGEYSKAVTALMQNYNIILKNGMYRYRRVIPEGELQLYMSKTTLFNEPVTVYVNYIKDGNIKEMKAADGVNLQIEYYDQDQECYVKAKRTQYDLTDKDYFVLTPLCAGKYRITANYDGLESTSSILKSGKRALKIIVQNVTASLSARDTERELKAPIFEGAVDDRTTRWLIPDLDYKQTSEGVKATEAGEYPIEFSFIKLGGEYTSTVRELMRDYDCTIENATYHLETTKYTVEASAKGKGIVTIKNMDKAQTAIPSGSQVYEGTNIQFQAKANDRYQIKRWTTMVGDTETVVTDKDGTVGGEKPYTGDTIEISHLNKNASYTVYFEEYKVLLNLPEDRTYGQSANMTITYFDGENYVDISDKSVSWDIQKYDAKADKYIKAEDSQYSINGHVFTPKTTGKFLLIANYDGNISNEAVINVAKKEIQLVAQDVNTYTDASSKNRALKKAVLTGLNKWDQDYATSLQDGKDYKQTCTGVEATKAGNYTIKIQLLTASDSDAMKKLTENYDIKTVNAVYVLNPPKVKKYTLTITKADGGKITVTDAKGKTYVTGDKITEGAKLTALATPSKGYGFSKWTKGVTGTVDIRIFTVKSDITLAASFVKYVGINYGLSVTGTAPITVKWGKVPGVDGYDIFMVPCGKSFDYTKPVKTVSKTSTSTSISAINKVKLTKIPTYKMVIRAFVNKGGKKDYVESSASIHRVGNAKGYTNSKAVTLNFATATMRVGTAKMIKATAVKNVSSRKLLGSDHGKAFQYYSTNTKVAVVKDGKITAKGKGTCKIYVISMNGSSKYIMVTVK